MILKMTAGNVGPATDPGRTGHIFRKKVLLFFGWLNFCPTFTDMNNTTPLTREQRLRARMLFMTAEKMQKSLASTFDLDPIAVRIEGRAQHSAHCLYMDCVQFDRKMTFDDGLTCSEMLLHLQHEFRSIECHVEDTYVSPCGTRVCFVLYVNV